jgi:ABC-type xylose transport system permease subunit
MAQQTTNLDPSAGSITRFLRATEIDTRLLGMIAALLLIWVGFHLYGVIVNGNGAFLTPRNLWNISVQTSSVGIMACGMVLVIITVGTTIGAFQGWLVGYRGIPAFIVTLGGLLVWRNVAWYLTNGARRSARSTRLPAASAARTARWERRVAGSWAIGWRGAPVDARIRAAQQGQRHAFPQAALGRVASWAPIIGCAILGFVMC